ncbi:hypothetical protein [Streptomyces sp. GESEQ-35]|uniref:hypothetical protein n=1 Tax=Streptomyces sp. GESEQ-35 TaxID=2812657 RepID=UPI001B332945|nr:hypothetical protein [Streptomyces sp. GESEQ-35]
MAQPEVRPRIVALLCDADFIYRTDTRTWSHLDGRPFTHAEQVIALQATRAEADEARAQLMRYLEYRRTKREAGDVLTHFLDPFLDQLREKTLDNAAEIMGKEDRAELDRILRLVREPVRPFAPYTF